MNSRRLGMEGFFIPRRYRNGTGPQAPNHESCRIPSPFKRGDQRGSLADLASGGKSSPRTPKIRSRVNSTMM